MVKLRALKLRLRKRLRSQRHTVENLSTQTEKNFDQNLFNRLNKFGMVWRFVSIWLLLLILLLGCLVAQNQALSSYYQHPSPVPGGIYSEGTLGSFTNASPLYATSDVDSTVSRLIFSGLFRTDNTNKLVGDLATSWEVDAKGTTYTVHLRPNLIWQDGKPLTADDVAFTYHVIQNPDAQSPLNSSWQNITVTALNATTVTFKLSNPLASFIHTLKNGIVPAHILKSVPASDLRSVSFNTQNPIGSGPFEWNDIQVRGTGPANAEVQIALKPFANYWQGRPKLESFVVHAFASKQAMIDAYKARNITAMTGLDEMPASISETGDTVIHNLRLNAATMVFFKTSTGILSDTKVRRALIEAIDIKAVLAKLEYQARPVNEPLLKDQLGYNPAYAQVGYNEVQAKTDLTAAGWQPGPKGILQKAGQDLRFSLFAGQNAEYSKVATALKDQWRAIGVDVQVNVQPSEDFKNTLAGHTYDAVLHGITIGSDPDVFVYWHSSQTDVRSANRLNFSEYKSADADSSLQAGRSRIDPALRAIKYQSFLANWQQDAPAFGLYQPRYLYITHGPVYGLNDHGISAGIDRLSGVEDWMIRTANVTN